MKSNYKRLGDYIREVNVRNRDLAVTELVGLSIDKIFIPSVANTIGTDMSNYKIIRKGQFACSLMQVSRDEKIPISMLRDDEAIMSPAYPMFEVINTEVLLPEYLMMWFSRSEFDREASFYAVGGVRGSLTWEDFCNLTLPIPSIEIQREIVTEYEVLSRRIALNESLCDKLEQAAAAFYRKMFIDDIDPENLPHDWRMGTIGEICDIKAGGDKPKIFSATKTTNCKIPIYSNGVTDKGLYGYTDKSNYPKDSITISARGTIGYCVLRREDFDAIVRLLVLISKIDCSSIYLWKTICKMEFSDSGSVQNQLTIPQVGVLSILIPPNDILEKYDSIAKQIYTEISVLNSEAHKLSELKELLLSKLATN